MKKKFFFSVFVMLPFFLLAQMRLEVEGDAHFSTSSGAAVNIGGDGNGDFAWLGLLEDSDVDQETGIRLEYNGTSNELNFVEYTLGTKGVDLLSIERAGNVGIGTSTPDAKLHVEGDLKIVPTTDTDVDLWTEISRVDTDDEFPSYIMSILPKGDLDNVALTEVNIGSNSNRWDNYYGKFIDLGSSLGSGKLKLYSSGSSYYGLGVTAGHFQLNLNGSGAKYAFYDDDNISTRTEIFTITGVGTIGIGDPTPDYKLEVTGSAGKPGGGFWSDSSDRRLKKDVEDFEDGLAEVLKIRPVWYRFNGKFGLPTEERYVGVIAQEMQKVAPYTVDSYIETDDETGETGEYLNYNGTAVVYMLVNAVQEQQTIIEEKDALLEELQTELDGVKSRLYKIETLVSGKMGNQKISKQVTSLTDAKLFPNQPNPFSESTLIRYYIPEGRVKPEIRITSLEGKPIKAIPIQATGKGQLTLSAQTLSPGTYLYSLIVNGELIATQKMVLIGRK